MKLFMYLQALARTIAQRRFKTIEVFNESAESKTTKSYALYKLAMDPTMTSKKAMAELYGQRSGKGSQDKLFSNLVERTVHRLENLLLLTDPSLYSDDESYHTHVKAVRSLVTGLFLAQNGLIVGALSHLKKGLKQREMIPAEWQGLCVAALRYLILYNSQFGSRSKTEEYSRKQNNLLIAIQVESDLRVRHDILYASARGSSLRNHANRTQWHVLHKACARALAQHNEHWFAVSLARISITALQATGQYEKMLTELAASPLPRVEINLYTAVTCLELGHLSNAIKHAVAAHDEYKPGSANWLTCINVAMRGHMLTGNVDQALVLAEEIRQYPRLYERDTALDAWIGMIEAYCHSYRQMRLHGPRRRGRPTQRYQRFKAQLRDSATSRQVYITSSVWQLIDARAQHQDELYEQTLMNMLRYVRRRKDLRNHHRFGVFVEFLFKHRYCAPTEAQLVKYTNDLKSIGNKFSNGEIISYEILGRVLTSDQ
jgi:hypothetical protein